MAAVTSAVLVSWWQFVSVLGLCVLRQRQRTEGSPDEEKPTVSAIYPRLLGDRPLGRSTWHHLLDTCDPIQSDYYC